MAKCHICKKEMLTASGCCGEKIRANGKLYPRIRMGDPNDFFPDASDDARCGDCGAMRGGLHHWGCDCERCPACGEQLISCYCKNVCLVV